MDTKSRILDEALTLFSEKGYANVYVGEIADRVGIKAPSLYKHFRNKQAIFDAIIEEMEHRFLEEAKTLRIRGNDVAADAGIYRNLSEKQMIRLGIDLFRYQLHDDYARRFRKMLTIEQFHDPSLGAVYTKQYIDDPLSYEGMLLGIMAEQGVLQTENAEIMTLHFYAPFYMLLTLCDREPDRETDAVRILKDHMAQFNKLYRRQAI